MLRNIFVIVSLEQEAQAGFLLSLAREWRCPVLARSARRMHQGQSYGELGVSYNVMRTFIGTSEDQAIMMLAQRPSCHHLRRRSLLLLIPVLHKPLIPKSLSCAG